MKLSTSLLILAVVASIDASDRDNWSWGPDGTHAGLSSPSISSSPLTSSSISGRTLSFPASEHKSASTIQEEIVQPSLQRASAIQTVRAPRLIQATSGQSLQTFAPPPLLQTTQPATRIPAAAVSVQSQTTGNNHGGVNRNGKALRDGQAEGRFLGIKEKLCGVGIGFDCKKGYESHGHHKSSGISVYDVSYVQPIQVVPVGGPIAAVPVNKGPKGHHQKAHHSAPAYHPPQPVYSPPQPAYHPPTAPVSGYGAPAPTYGAPAPVYSPPKATYRPPASSYATPSHSSYTPPSSSYSKGPPATVVQHVHTHHHIYNGPSSQGGYAFGKDNSFSGTSSTSSTFKTFGSATKKLGNSLPVIPPRKGFLTPTTQSTAYREDCQCVARQYCTTFDIVQRSGRALPLLDARTRQTDILSTATDEEDLSVDSAVNDLTFSASETQNTVVESADEQGENQEFQRVKRESITIAVQDIDPAVNPTSRQSRQFSFNAYTPGLSGCAASHVCCRSPVFRSQRDVATCGRRSSVGLLGRVKNTIFEQGDTEFGEYPWQAAILRKEGADNVYVCGAVLIDTRHLLTAAHCVSGLNPADLKVRLGEWDVGSEDEVYRHIESPVSGVYSHPEFYSGNLNNDIAVLRLFSPVDLVTSPHISPICFPDRFANFNGQRCHVTGWGKDAFGDTGDFQHLLKEVDLPMVDRTSCLSALRQTRLGFQFSLHQGMICAGGEEGKDACEGDGGSPLVCRGQDGTVQLAGLVSWGVGCGRRGVPGVYTNVPHYLTWIRSITRV